MKAKVDSTKVAMMSRTMTVGGGDMKWATVSIDDHTSAVIVFGLTQKEADERANLIVEGLNRLKSSSLDVVATTGGKATVGR